MEPELTLEGLLTGEQRFDSKTEARIVAEQTKTGMSRARIIEAAINTYIRSKKSEYGNNSANSDFNT